jgi:tRNA splicing ligase
MSQILTLEISEQVFAAIQRQATATGVTPERLAAILIEQRFTQIPELCVDEAQKEIARARFERHFGTLSPNNAVSLNNESIDADLAKEYANTHEDE